MRILLIFTLLTVPLYAQVSAQSPLDAFHVAVAAYGGSALDAVSSIRIVGTSTTSSGTTPVQISATLDGQLRIDYGDATNPQRSIIQTSMGQLVINAGNVQRKPPHVDLYAQLDWVSILGLKYLNVGPVTWTDGGADTVGGRPTRVVNADNGQQKRQYGRTLANQVAIDLDAQTGLVAQLRRQQRSDNSLDFVFTVSFSFSDHRQVGNIVFPFRIDKAVNSRVVETITVSDVQLNPALSNGLFER
jgi:hypothetical protein